MHASFHMRPELLDTPSRKPERDMIAFDTHRAGVRTPASGANFCAVCSASARLSSARRWLSRPTTKRHNDLHTTRLAAENGEGNQDTPQAAPIAPKYPGPAYTFILAGFLKIITVGGVAMSAPTEVSRTVLGRMSQYLLIPVGLGLCWIAKQITDSGLHESPGFGVRLLGALVAIYFALVTVLYRYNGSRELLLQPRARMHGPMADVRSAAGDRDVSGYAMGYSGNREYKLDKPGMYDDLAYYEGRYPSQGGDQGPALPISENEEENPRQTALPRPVFKRGRPLNRRSYITSEGVN